MTLQFNNFVKVNCIINAITTTSFSGNNTVKIYPSSVTFPTIPLGAAPAGFLISFTNVIFAINGNQMVLAGTPASQTQWAVNRGARNLHDRSGLKNLDREVSEQG